MPNFRMSEFRSSDGAAYVRLSPTLVECAQAVRDRLGVPIGVESGYRTPSFNDKLKNAKCGSQHVSVHEHSLLCLFGFVSDSGPRRSNVPRYALVSNVLSRLLGSPVLAFPPLFFSSSLVCFSVLGLGPVSRLLPVSCCHCLDDWADLWPRDGHEHPTRPGDDGPRAGNRQHTRLHPQPRPVWHYRHAGQAAHGPH